jgi:hypothetical protein
MSTSETLEYVEFLVLQEVIKKENSTVSEDRE